MTGLEAIAAFKMAAHYVKEGRLDEARAMRDQLLPSDWTVIEQRISKAEADAS